MIAVMNPVLRKKLNILVRLANIDGDFASVERSFIDEIARKNGLKEADLAEILRNPEPIGSLGALSYSKAVEYLCDSLSLIAVDEKILPSEVTLCTDIGLRLGFYKKGIDEIISSMKSSGVMSYSKIEKAVRALPHAGK